MLIYLRSLAGVPPDWWQPVVSSETITYEECETTECVTELEPLEVCEDANFREIDNAIEELHEENRALRAELAYVLRKLESMERSELSYYL